MDRSQRITTEIDRPKKKWNEEISKRKCAIENAFESIFCVFSFCFALKKKIVGRVPESNWSDVARTTKKIVRMQFNQKEKTKNKRQNLKKLNFLVVSSATDVRRICVGIVSNNNKGKSVQLLCKINHILCDVHNCLRTCKSGPSTEEKRPKKGNEKKQKYWHWQWKWTK